MANLIALVDKVLARTPEYRAVGCWVFRDDSSCWGFVDTFREKESV